MPKKRILFGFLLFMILSSMLFSANLTSSASKKIALNKKALSMLEHQKYTLKLTGAKKKNVTWSSSDKSIASVKNGVVRAKKTGRCTITAKRLGRKYKCTVRVKSSKTKNIDSNDSTPTPIPTPTPSPSPIVDSKPIYLSAKINDTNNRSLILTITNETNVDVLTGMDFILEKSENGEWRTVAFKKNVAFISLAMIIPAKGNAPLSVSLDSYFDNLTKGTYRISKQIYSNYVIYADFMLD